jgi:outer membrane protein assembly factor BamB
VLDDSAIAWNSKDVRQVSSDVPTPAFYDGDFFVLSDLQGKLSRVEPKTGKVKWTINTPGDSKYEASPLAADGKIYLIGVHQRSVRSTVHTYHTQFILHWQGTLNRHPRN